MNILHMLDQAYKNIFNTGKKPPSPGTTRRVGLDKLTKPAPMRPPTPGGSIPIRNAQPVPNTPRWGAFNANPQGGWQNPQQQQLSPQDATPLQQTQPSMMMQGRSGRGLQGSRTGLLEFQNIYNPYSMSGVDQPLVKQRPIYQLPRSVNKARSNKGYSI